MEGDTSTSQQEQIALYGLFGDSSTTLQGLNDHLTPSLLQQSPPCGSVIPTQITVGKSVNASPLKGALNGLQQGVLLSDLADRSPSAGSVTATLCNHVSSDNIRCMNLITAKGQRFCTQHSRDQSLNASSAKKAIFERVVPGTNSCKPVGFVPVMPILGGNANNVLSAPQLSLNKLNRTAKLDTKQVMGGTLKPSGVDVPDNSNLSGFMSNINQKSQQPQVCIVRKVGQQITVTTRSPVALKLGDTGMTKPSGMLAPNFGHNLQSATSPMLQTPKTLLLNPPKHYNKKPELASQPVAQAVQVTLKTSNIPASTSVAGYATTQPSATRIKTQTMDEDVIKKLVEVLNSRSDLSPHQQISLLQSMGVTVVPSPAGINSSARKNKPSKVVSGKITVTKSKNPVIVGVTSPLTGQKTVTLPAGFTQQNYSSNGAVLKSQMAILGQQTLTNKSTALPGQKSKLQNKKVENRPAQKRKKPTEAVSAKKSKPAISGQVPDVSIPKPWPTSDIKKVKPVKMSGRTKQTKQTSVSTGSRSVSSSLLSANSPQKLLRVPQQTLQSIANLAEYLNEKLALRHDIFSSEAIEANDGTALDSDKNKTLKSRLLKKHVLRKRKLQSSTTEKVNYKQCLKDLRGTDFCKLFSSARNLLQLIQCGAVGKRSTFHHEKILEDLLSNNDLFWESILHDNSDNMDILENVRDTETSENLNYEEKSAYTLRTIHLRNQYEMLMRQWNYEEKEIAMLLECYNKDPTATMQLLNCAIGDTKCSKRCSTVKSEVSYERQCQLSSHSGLSCNARALPYSHYCKQHIWHCQNQCLYKLDPNMKPAADISPEPLVKKVRKKAKLLPLIKKYKKKKKKRPEVAENADSVTDGMSKPAATMDKFHESEVTSSVPQKMSTAVNTKESLFTDKNFTSMRVDDSDLDDAKPSDTSEDDLSLTTAQEIMLSGVLDKLQDDPQEFDLFTTDKGAEELERALLLAASSPPPDHDDGGIAMTDVHNPSNLISSSSRSNSLENLDTTLLTNPKLNHSPDAIVNCDAPKSDEQPPSLESLNQSQIAHYTFGSNLPPAINKKDIPEVSYSAEDESVPPMISAEDLRDIEGVLERMHAEDVNSPKLPSSPAIDHYTSMLARQLSQEVEGETLKEQTSSSAPILPVVPNPFPTVNGTSTSLSLPTGTIRSMNTSRLVDGNTNISKDSNITIQSTAVSMTRPTVQLVGQDAVSANPGRQSGLSAVVMKTMTNSISAVTFSHSMATSQSRMLNMQSSISSDPVLKPLARSLSNVSKSSVQTAPSNFVRKNTTAPPLKLSNPISVSSVARSQQGKTQQTSVLTNPVLPVTLMQTSSAQGGNVIKVIVPPGTMVNGANGQQNMLLIPVGALMKPNTASGNIPTGIANATGNQNTASTVNIKAQLSNLQAGQQFFIVNNVPGSSQPHLALVQKPATAGSSSQQQGVFLKPAQRSVALQKDENANGQKQVNLATQMASNSKTKSNLNLQLKQIKSNFKQSKVASSTLPVVDGKINVMPSRSVVGVPTTVSNAVLNAKLVSSGFNKLTVPTQGRRGKGRSAPRKPKAKFDPVTKKYVPITTTMPEVPPSSSTTVSIPVMSGTNQKMAESLLKFNQSTLSIQNKVQQIDSVLLSLNAAKNQTGTLGKNLTNGHQEKKTKGVSWTVRSVVYPTDNNTILIPGPAKTTGIKAAPSATAAVPQVISPLPQTNAALSTSQAQTPKTKSATVQVTKADTARQIFSAPVTTVPSNTTAKPSDSKTATVPVSSGTVHWNQTTTAGPEITTTTLTVPVYITGAIPADAWPGEIALNGSVPIILPARKISPNCQIPQRVLLGNLGSLAVPTRVRMATGTTSSPMLKQSLISVPQSIATLGVNKNSTGSTAVTPKVSVKTNVSANSVDPKTTASAYTLPQQLVTTCAPTPICTALSMKSVATSAASDGISASPSGVAVTTTVKKTAEDTSMSRQKSGRKASHDTILHDPLMYDPTMLDRIPADGSD